MNYRIFQYDGKFTHNTKTNYVFRVINLNNFDFYLNPSKVLITSRARQIL